MLLSILFSQICEEFREISRRLYDRSNCIEDLSEQREYMKTIPEQVGHPRPGSLGMRLGEWSLGMRLWGMEPGNEAMGNGTWEWV